MKVLHVLYQSYPDLAGASTRGSDIVNSQKEIGLNPVVITSPFQAPIVNGAVIENIDDIKYYRTFCGNFNETLSEEKKSFLLKLKKLSRIFKFYNQIKSVIVSESIQVIHAHAMFFCGIPAILLGKKYNIPVIYEVRSLWEERSLNSSRRRLLGRINAFFITKIENFVMKNANHVISINDELTKNLNSRGIDIKKISTVKNGVNLSFISDQISRSKYNLNANIHRFGYIGSFTIIEGIPLLIRAFDELTLNYKNIELHLWGKGDDSFIKEIKILIDKTTNVFYHGSIDRNDIIKAYDNIDYVVNPRIKSKLTDSVTPLKPLEAMGFGKLVIGSDVGGIRELIKDKDTGLLFEADNKHKLVSILEEVLTLDSKKEIIERGLNYVRKNRNWLSNAEIYRLIYVDLIASRRRSTDISY